MQAYIFKNFANLASFFLFCSMGSILQPIWEAGETLEYYVYPYLVLFLSCGLWSLYGVPKVKGQSGNYSISASAVGCGMSIIYLIIFGCCSTRRKNFIILVFVGVEVLIIIAVGVVSLEVVKSVSVRTNIVGWFALICGGAMYGSPLWTMTEVAETRKLRLMRLWVCLLGIVNGVLWVCYGFLLDPYDQAIVLGNGVGAGFSLLQAVFYIYQFFRVRHDPVDVGVEPIRHFVLQTLAKSKLLREWM